MDKIIYSWKELDADTRTLCNNIKQINFVPDYVVGIIRGGAIPAVICSHAFDCPVVLVYCSFRDTNIQDYTRLDQISKDAHSGKKVLIIDDIVDSGKTIAAIKDRMINTHQNILYAALWYNPSQTLVDIDLWVRAIDRSIDERWIVFPYERQ